MNEMLSRSVALCPCAMGQFATHGGSGIRIVPQSSSAPELCGFLQRPNSGRATGASRSRPGAVECVESLGVQISWVNDAKPRGIEVIKSSQRYLGLEHVS